jgi:hypothetical protein
MIIEEKTFNDFAQKTLERLDELRTLLKAKNRLNGETLYDNQDLCLMLHLSKRSLQRYRSLGMLKYMHIGQKTFYTASDVQQFIKDHIVKGGKEDDDSCVET